MSAGVNLVILVGNLGDKPQVARSERGTVCQFSIAVNTSFEDRTTKQRREHVEWVDVTTFGPLAEVCAKHLDKGRAVYVEGSIRRLSWTDKDGVQRYDRDVKAHKVTFLSDGRGSNRAPRPELGNELPPGGAT